MVELEEPDKGRAWVVAFSACIINMILSGLSRMIGILYVAVIDSYGVTREEATLPFIVRNGVRCLTGPVVGIVGQRFGIRTVTFWGGVLATAGATLCCIAPNVIWITVFWGGLHGCGFAFANTLFQVVVNQYFQKYRVTASGIALSGACFGSFVFPFMLEEILNKYDLHGGFLIIGGIVMHVLPPALLLSSPQWIQYPEAYARLRALQDSGKEAAPEIIVTLENGKPSSCADTISIRSARTTSFSNCLVESTEVLKLSRQNSHESGVFRAPEEFPRDRSRGGSTKNVICTLYRMRESPNVNKKSILQNGCNASLEAGSVYSISRQICEDKNSSKKNESGSTKNDAHDAKAQSILESVKVMARLWKNPVYAIISICLTTYMFILVPIFTVVVDYGADKGIPASAGKYFINAMAIGDLAGRLCFGWVTDKGYMTISSFSALLQFLQGVSVILLPFAMSLSTFIMALMFYGMMAGGILVLFPVSVLQYTSTNEQSVAIASVGVLSGIMAFTVPPLIGHFRDVVGSYDGMFYVSGAMSMMGGALWLLEPRMMKWHSHETEAEQDKIHSAANKNGEKELVNGAR